MKNQSSLDTWKQHLSSRLIIRWNKNHVLYFTSLYITRKFHGKEELLFISFKLSSDIGFYWMLVSMEVFGFLIIFVFLFNCLDINEIENFLLKLKNDIFLVLGEMTELNMEYAFWIQESRMKPNIDMETLISFLTQEFVVLTW